MNIDTIIKNWCAACGMPEPSAGECEALNTAIQAAAGNKFSGWKLVPVEPTSEMLVRGGEDFFDAARNWRTGSTLRDQDHAAMIYEAMLAAAPQAPATAIPDEFGTAEHWKEKAQYWAGVAHRLRGEALRGEPVDGIVQPTAPQAPAAPVAVVPDAWQPIETAPKNGRLMLLGYINSCGKWRTTRGQWINQEYIDEYAEDPESMSPGWYETTIEDDDGKCWPIEPTRWQPLPPPPQGFSNDQ